MFLVGILYFGKDKDWICVWHVDKLRLRPLQICTKFSGCFIISEAFQINQFLPFGKNFNLPYIILDGFPKELNHKYYYFYCQFAPHFSSTRFSGIRIHLISIIFTYIRNIYYHNLK